jgi:hypothetical protein
MPLIEFEKLEQTQQQIAELLGPLATQIPNYQDRDTKSIDNPWEKAYHGSFRVLEDYDEEIHSAISGIDLRIRAYHATRLRDINVLQTQGLLQLDINRVRAELLRFAEQIIGKPVPEIVIEKWIEEIERPAGYYSLSRVTSKGPIFSLGVGPMFRPSNTGRYFTEGGEIIYQIAPDLSALLRKHEPSFTLSDQEFWEQYWAEAIPALVICDLPYDELLPKKQYDIRHYLMKAALFDDDPANGYWQGGWIELSVNQDIPPEWIVEVVKPEINKRRISFNPELDSYNKPMYWEL